MRLTRKEMQKTWNLKFLRNREVERSGMQKPEADDAVE